jgi:chromosome segregation ATPase
VNGSPEKALRFYDTESAADVNSRPGADEPRDWSASLNLVHKAGVSLREAEEQTQKLVTRAQAILERANQELESAYEGLAQAEERAQAAETRAEHAETGIKEADARAQLAETRARGAEARAHVAETRAKEAEEWLQRIHQAILDEFSPRAADDSAHVAGNGASADRNTDVVLMRQGADPRRLKAI